jgi:hypothetical protein
MPSNYNSDTESTWDSTDDTCDWEESTDDTSDWNSGDSGSDWSYESEIETLEYDVPEVEVVSDWRDILLNGTADSVVKTASEATELADGFAETDIDLDAGGDLLTEVADIMPEVAISAVGIAAIGALAFGGFKLIKKSFRPNPNHETNQEETKTHPVERPITRHNVDHNSGF